MVELNGKMVPGIMVTCSFCDKVVECAGMDGQALRQKAVGLLRKGCREPYAPHRIPSDTEE